jgi:UPF0716 protein FxsA
MCVITSSASRGKEIPMRFVVLAIVLAFPLLDLYATVRVARWTGVPVWIWLALPMTAGLLLLRNERVNFRSHMIAAMHGEQSLLRGLVDSGRKVAAAMLFLLPGIVSDLIALVLLALPINLGRHAEAMAGSSAIEGHYRRLD